MSDYPIALWSFNLSRAPASVEVLARLIDEEMRKSAVTGARLIMLPEYFIECCLAFKPADLTPDLEMAFLADVGVELLKLVAPLPQKHGISILLGTMPVKSDNGITNSAFLLTADGRCIRQDKLCLTPFEQDPETWRLTPGSELVVFELDGLKMAILICLDIEMPALSCLLAATKPDLVLVPSMTEKLSGYHRVFGCAKARAVELMCAVAVCGVVGVSKGTTQNESSVSGAALYVPCEESLGFTGVAAEIAATDGTGSEEPLLTCAVPMAELTALKDGKAEVWPGAWSAALVSLNVDDAREFVSK
ncbi:nitrilase-related carbon-nitrogen hydrolase [Roseibium sp. MMSF_3412]|uniref:nitrilase-related carbon-nitrogen hydrolase n=1 Tax=Roseibium sp. MMSF_3412 TaxID=3046712 RepID=UPI00273F888E|nr:nitrilase-related carbon-nitrogen hydrolase [Roseibium sp. MMSF_3412]